MAGLVGFPFIAPLLTVPFYDFNLMKTFEVMTNPLSDPTSKVPLLIVQGVVSAGTFILIPGWIVKRYLHISLGEFFTIERNSYLPSLVTLILVFTFMGFNSFFIYWNMNMELPESMATFESMIRSMEDQLEILTKHLTSFDSFWQFLLGFIVIAIIPGVGEELLFRGLIQNTFDKIFKNPHLAIWLAAFLFGVFHFQFYGVIPRILLGALFGYLYYFSGHLGYAMFAHFLNNGFMIVMLYIFQSGWVDYDIETMDNDPNIWASLLSGVVSVALIWTFHKHFSSRQNGLSKNI